MTSKLAINEVQIARLAFGLLPFALLIVALAAARTWLKMTIGSPMFTLVVAAVTISGMAYANYLSFRFHRALDEVHKASVDFAARWSMLAGQAAFVLLLFLPPFRDFMTFLVIEFGGPGPGVIVDPSVIVFAVTLGFMGVAILQAIATMAFRLIWWKSKQ